MSEKKPCEEFNISVKRMKRLAHKRLPRGYRLDPKEYNAIELMPTPSCENCKAPFKKDREVTIGGYTRTDNGCKQKKVCREWTPFPQEIEGCVSTDEI